MNFKNIKIVFVFTAFILTACKRDHNDQGTEFAPQMYVSKAYEPYTQVAKNNLNPMGLNMRTPVKGTIARRRYNTLFASSDTSGNTVSKVNLMLYHIHKDSIALAERTLFNPLPPTDQNIEEGKVLFLRFCAPCHGENGDGKGLVGGMYKGVPDYKAAAQKNLNDGHIFHTITHGIRRMWPHGSQLNPEERWKIVFYVHTLQGQEIRGRESKSADTTKTEGGDEELKKEEK